MQAKSEKLEGSRVRLSIELDTEDLEKEYDRTVKRVAGRVNIKGFRRGKAPRRIVETYVGRDLLLTELVEEMVPRAVSDAVRDTGVEPIGDSQPEFDLPELPSLDQPFNFSVEMAVAPTTQLGDISDLLIHPEPPEVTDAELEEDLGQLLRSEAKWAVTERPARLGDRVDMRIQISGEGVTDSEPQPYGVVLGENGFPTGYDDTVAGHSSGDKVEFVADIPKDDPNIELRGKRVTFMMQLESINERILPELTDEFARSLGSYTSVDDLRKSLQARRLDAKLHEEQHRLEEEALDGLVQRTTFDIPEVLIASESETVLKSRTDALVAQGVAVDTYLAMQGQTRTDLEADARQVAERHIRNGLALEAFAEAHAIQIEPEEIEAEIERVAGQYPQERRNVVRQQLGARAAQIHLESGVRNRKSLTKLLEEVTGGASPLHDHAGEPSQEGLEVAEVLSADMEPEQPMGDTPSQDRSA